MADGRLHGGHHDVGHILAHFAGEVEHARERRVAEAAAHDGGVLVGVGGVQADGDRVHDALELRRDIAAADQAALAVGVHAHGQVVAALHFGGHALEHVEGAGRLAVAAEDHLFVAAHVLLIECGHDLLEGGLVVEPQVVLAAFAVLAHAVGGLADAEGAGAAAAVGQVDIEPVVHGVYDGLGFRFRHDEPLSLEVGAKVAMRFAFPFPFRVRLKVRLLQGARPRPARGARC